MRLIDGPWHYTASLSARDVPVIKLQLVNKQIFFVWSISYSPSFSKCICAKTFQVQHSFSSSTFFVPFSFDSAAYSQSAPRPRKLDDRLCVCVCWKSFPTNTSLFSFFSTANKHCAIGLRKPQFQNSQSKAKQASTQEQTEWFFFAFTQSALNDHIFQNPWIYVKHHSKVKIHYTCNVFFW